MELEKHVFNIYKKTAVDLLYLLNCLQNTLTLTSNMYVLYSVFFLLFTGEDIVESTHGLLTTVAFQKEQQLFLISFF